MKRWLPFILVLAIGVGALVLSQKRKPQVDPGPNALVNMVADAQREASRVPARLTRISDSEEISIGDQMAQQYLVTIWSRNLSPDDGLVQAYVERVGNRVMPYASRKLPYRFHYIPDQNFYNAFALPGGQVFIGKGLISLMRNEDELASVLAHELEHVDLYHCAERVQIEARMRNVPLGSLVTLPMRLFQA
ncbi:MAG: M48 family metalloprotease, partial [Acidobacteriales bacterium]|nr:M48 family metalloprotease [Terriglobales bacterium]